MNHLAVESKHLLSERIRSQTQKSSYDREVKYDQSEDEEVEHKRDDGKMYYKCPKCNTRNEISKKSCKSCGTRRTEEMRRSAIENALLYKQKLSDPKFLMRDKMV